MADRLKGGCESKKVCDSSEMGRSLTNEKGKIAKRQKTKLFIVFVKKSWKQDQLIRRREKGENRYFQIVWPNKFETKNLKVANENAEKKSIFLNQALPVKSTNKKYFKISFAKNVTKNQKLGQISRK